MTSATTASDLIRSGKRWDPAGARGLLWGAIPHASGTEWCRRSRSLASNHLDRTGDGCAASCWLSGRRAGGSRRIL